MPEVSSKFSLAVAQHRAGNYQQAESIYREMLAGDPQGRDPNHADTLHLLGLIASEAGQHAVAGVLIMKAIHVRGPEPVYCTNLGVALSRQGKLDEAIACYRQALQGAPGDARTYARLGRTLMQQGQLEQAAEAFRASTSLDPNAAEIHFELGNTLHAAGDYEEAALSYLGAIACRADHAEAFHNLGVTRTMQQRTGDAIAAYEQAVRIRPDYPEPHNNLGTLMQAIGNDDRARYHYNQALKLTPESLEVRYNLALFAQERDQLEEAVGGYRELLERKPDHVEARNNLGNTLLALGRPEEAMASYKRTLQDDPDSVSACWNLGVAQLTLGQFEEGWPGHERRFDQKGAQRRDLSQPQWDGSELNGRRILLHAEQGLGDTLQFVRYASMVQQRGGVVILECQEPLLRLLGGARGIDHLIARGHSLPEFDCQAPLLSLPGIFRTGLDTIPAATPYLEVCPAEVDRWHEVIRRRVGARRGLKVGLTWAGNPRHVNDRNRSIPASELAALAGLSGAIFFGLQKGTAGPPELDMIELLDTSSDMRDTAAILMNLDLLISVDTAVAHLAGALGKPVWTLLPLAPDWRWMVGRVDTPWYPQMRLFRQERRKDWGGVLRRVRGELE